MKKIIFIKLIGFLLCVNILYAQTPAVPTILGPSTQTICAGKSTYFSANCATGTPKWYNGIRTVLLGSGETFYTPTITSTTNYTVRCETNTAIGNHVLLTVNMTAASNISTNITMSESCFGQYAQNMTLTANPTNVGTNPKYFWTKNDEPLGMIYRNPIFDKSVEDTTLVNDIYVHTNGDVYIRYEDEVKVLPANGGNRTIGYSSNAEFKKIFVDENSVIYVATGSGLLKAGPSDNSFINTGLSTNIVSNCTNVSKNGFIYVGTHRNGIAISKDGGNTFSFKTTADGLGSNYITDIAITQEGKIYVAAPTDENSTSSGFSYSDDGGETFHSTSQKNNSLGSNQTYDIFVDGDNKIYVATANGLSISTDGGLTFVNKTRVNGLGSRDISSVFVTKNGDIYAGNIIDNNNRNEIGGLSVSTNGGDTFVNYNTNDGLLNRYITAVGVRNRNISGQELSVIYVGTRSGLYTGFRGNSTNTLQLSNIQAGDEYHLSIEPSAGLCPVPSFASKRIIIGNIPRVQENATVQNVCVGSSVNLTATCVDGSVIWYDSPTASRSVGSGSPFAVSPTTDKVYYPTCYIDNFCQSNRNSGIRFYSGTLATNAPKFFRPKSFTETIEDNKNNIQPVEYQTQSVSIARAGEHTFSIDTDEGGNISKANANTFLCLYNSNGFNPESPLNNLVAFSTTNTRAITMSNLAVGNYTLVLSRYEHPTLFDLSPLPWTYQISQRNTIQAPRVKVYVNPIPAIPTVTTNNIAVCSGSSALLVANCASSGGIKNTPVWYNQTDIYFSNALFSGSNFNIPYLSANTSYKVRCESNYCASTTAQTVSISVVTVDDLPSVATNQEICLGANATFTSSCGTANTVVWYDSGGTVKLADGNNFTPSDLTTSAIYKYACDNKQGCLGNFRSVTLTVNKTSPPTGVTNRHAIYKGNSLSLNAVCSTGDSIAWFSDNDDLLMKIYEGSPYITPNLSTNVTYKVACESQSCGKSTLEYIYIEVTDPTPTAPIAQANTAISWGSSTALTANGCSGSTGVYTLKWYNLIDNSEVAMPISPRIISNYYAKCELLINSKNYISNKSSTVEVSFNDMVTSVLSGNWEDTSTWNLSRIPIRTDNVMIDKNHTILLHSSPQIKNLIFNGTGQLKYNVVEANLKTGL
jgi:sugar lactone lactonase YvrE